ncbi:MAG: VWA domain-containing protein [Deltaproteobacteria bacterium]|jgi:Ca-activated chloride channel family protein|nr:VWA domain-containing protein [Deltaproteobacteria bacterium]
MSDLRSAGRRLLPALLLGLLVLVFPSGLSAQVVRDRLPEPMPMPVVDPLPRPASYEVEKVELIVEVDRQRAGVMLRQTVRNTGEFPLELDFLAPLPRGGQVSGLTLVADGREMVGRVHAREEALKIYSEIVARLRDPALIEFAGQGVFRARVFPIAPGKSSTLDLSFDYLAPKDGGLVDFNIPMAGALTRGRKIGLQEVAVRVAGSEAGGFYSPIPDVAVDRKPDSTTVSWKAEKGAPLPAFQFYYREDGGPMGGLILSHKPDAKDDGYFLFLAEPGSGGLEGAGAKPLPKTVVFALDRSGSMTGRQFEQAKNALAFVLKNLNPEDSFNLVDFSGGVNTWRPELEAMTPENRKSALDYVGSLRAGGATNIGGALETAFGLATGSGPAYLIFLTDGEPTVGVTDELDLVALAGRAAGSRGARLFCFGVGDKVNARLLDRLSEQGAGATAFVSESEDIEEKVGSFFDKMTYPALVDLDLTISLRTNRLLPGRLPDLFRGSQLVVAGRYPRPGEAKFTLTGSRGEERLSFDYETVLASKSVPGGDMVARLWARRRVGQIIDEIDREDGEKPNPELVEELVGLSKKYGILTPYTSFLAVEGEPLPDLPAQIERAASNLSALGVVVGSAANMQREQKADLALPVEAAPTSETLREFSEVDQYVGDGELFVPIVLAGRAFYLKNGRLLEGSVIDEDQRNLNSVRQMSPEWERLAAELPGDDLALLAQDKPVVFNFNGVNYLVEVADGGDGSSSSSDN